MFVYVLHKKFAVIVKDVTICTVGDLSMALILRFPNIRDTTFFKFKVWHKSSNIHFETSLKDFGIENNLQIHLGKEGGLLGGCDGENSKIRIDTDVISVIRTLAKKVTGNHSESENVVVQELLVSSIKITSESDGRHVAQKVFEDLVEENDDPEGQHL